jgi:hypothetical protein
MIYVYISQAGFREVVYTNECALLSLDKFLSTHIPFPTFELDEKHEEGNSHGACCGNY